MGTHAIFDCKTGKVEYKEVEGKPIPRPIIKVIKDIDPAKMIALLKEKGLITDESEVV